METDEQRRALRDEGSAEELSLEGLPYEVGLRVCGFLSPTDLVHLALASSHTHTLASDHSLWRERCLSEWRKPNLSPAIRTKIDLTSSTREIDWKRFYFQRKSLEKRWTEEKYVIHRIPHEGTTVIQVLRNNWKESDDDDHRENEKEGENESERMDVEPGAEEAATRPKRRKSFKKTKESEEATKSDEPEDGEKKTTQKKRKKGGRQKRNKGKEPGEELVDWGWDFVTGDDEGQVILWSGQEFKEKKVVKAHDFIWWLEVHSGTCVTASTDRTSKVIDLDTMKVVRTLTGHPTALWCVDFSIEEDYVVSGELASYMFGSGLFDVRCVVTDLPIPRRRIRLTGDDEDEGEGLGVADDAGEGGGESSPAVAPSSSSSLSLSSSTGGSGNQQTKMQRLAICTAVGEVDFFLYDVDTQQVIGAFTGHTATVTTVKRDSDLVLSGSDDKTIRVWDLATLKCIHTFSVGGIVYDIRLCENKLVAGVTGSQSSFLRVWDYVKRTHMMDIPVARVPRRIFSITVLPDRIYCSTNEHITVVDFRDVEGVEVKCKPKKSSRSRRERENCLLQ